MMKIKNHTGYFFPVCSDIIQSRLSECGFCPTHIEIALYGQDFVISICGENNTSLRAYTVNKEDYSRIIKETLRVNQAYFGEISERDVARGYGYWCCDWFYAGPKEAPNLYRDCTSHLVGQQAQAWCLVLANLLTPKDGKFNVQYNNRFEID